MKSESDWHKENIKNINIAAKSYEEAIAMHKEQTAQNIFIIAGTLSCLIPVCRNEEILN